MIGEASGEAAKATGRASEAQREVGHLDERVDRLTLICMALWKLLQDRTDLTEEDLMAKVRELDMMDGTADGKIQRKIKRCPKCDRTMSPQHSRCLYCGAADLQATAFDGVI